MSSSFRNELFALCNKLLEQDEAREIGQTIYNMSVSKESIETGKIERTLHGDFAQVAKHSNNEFHGYLFLDDNIGSIDIPSFFKVEHLAPDERVLFEKGHKTLTRFVELCLSDISDKSRVIAELMSPYSNYKPVSVSSEALPLLSDEDFTPAIAAFKNGKIYKTLIGTDFAVLFDKIEKEQLCVLFGSIEREISRSLGEDVAKDLKDFSLKLNSKYSNITDVMLAISLLIVALKLSLALACRLLYRAICGIDLFVLNNDNIISIEKNTSTVLCHFYRVFSQDSIIDYSGSEMGSIVLIDCDLPHGTHIHEFGMLISLTFNFAGEFGESSKYSFVSINEEMICIHCLTDEIIKIGLPSIKSQPK